MARPTAAAKKRVTPAADLAHRLERLEAERDILDVLHRYCQHLDNGDARAQASLFAPNATLDVRYVRRRGPDHREAGRAAIQRWTVIYTKTIRDRGARQQHLLTIPRIAVTGGAATTESYFTTVEERPGGPVVVATGRYRDRLVRRGGRWLFQERIAEVDS